MHLIHLAQIKELLAEIDVISLIEQGFIAYSNGRTIIPPVGELNFKNPPGDVHIKYGYLLDDDYYVIKIASGFYDNPNLNLPSGNGLMLLFSQRTGALIAILLDEGYLTDIRTAAAGAIAAKYLAPKIVHKIGIVGTGVQARLQLNFLKTVTACRDVVAWGRDANKLLNFQEKMQAQGFNVQTTQQLAVLAANCKLQFNRNHNTIDNATSVRA